jgi:hypothetical protein
VTRLREEFSTDAICVLCPAGWPEDIELRRNNEAFLDGLGARRISDPTTDGDFARRFDPDSTATNGN